MLLIGLMPITNGEIMSLARSAALLFLLCGLAQAQQLPKFEPDAQINYDRFRDITWYSTDEIGSLENGLLMRMYFGCPGDTDESPCVPAQVIIECKTFSSHAIDYRHRGVFILADRSRFQGELNMTYETNIREYIGTIPISLSLLRQLATAESVEMQIGNAQFALGNEAIGSLYNMAMLNARQRNIPSRNSRRRKSTFRSRLCTLHLCCA
jgi:hypothetical protein